MMNNMTVTEILDFFGIDTSVVTTKRLTPNPLGSLLESQDTVFNIDGEYTTHGLDVRIVQTRLTQATTQKTIVSELRVISGHKGTEILTPDNIFNVLATHLTQL